MARYSKMLSFLYFAFDALSIALCLYLTLGMLETTQTEQALWFTLAGAILLWLVAAIITELYSSNLHNGNRLRLRHYAKNHLYFIALIFLTKFLIPKVVILSNLDLLYFVICFVLVNISATYIIVSIISRFRRRDENIKNTIIIGIGRVALRISHYINSNPDFGFRIIGYMSTKDEECEVNQDLIVNSFSNLEDFLNTHFVNEIVIALPYKKSKTKNINRIINAANHQGARVSFVPDYEGVFGKNYKTIQDHELDAIKINQMPLDGVYPTLEKGIFDFLFSFIVLILLLPIFTSIAIAIKIDSRGSVLYCPTRVGRGGRNFKLFKFRTMSDNDDTKGGTKSTQKNDPRITHIGKKLRKYNLDELPQFLNVLLGSMSVVGPRPHRNYLNEKMKGHVDNYMVRHYFRPGITGWAQVNGWRGPTETEEQITQRSAHDLWYIENWSFSLDLKIIWMTIFARKALDNAF